MVINKNTSNHPVPSIIVGPYELGTKYPHIGEGGEGDIYNYENKYALKRFSLFNAMQWFYGEELKNKFRKVEAMTELKDESFCYPIGLLQSDSTTKEGCYSELVHFDPKFKDFSYLKELKNIRKLLGYIIQADAAIQRAHKSDVVIGDIKENNIMIDQNGNVKFVDADNYAYQDFDFDLFPERARSLELAFNHPVSMKDNDIFVFATMAMRILFKDESFNCFGYNKEFYDNFIAKLNVTAEVKDALRIIFSDAPNKPYIEPILQKIDFEQTLLLK